MLVPRTEQVRDGRFVIGRRHRRHGRVGFRIPIVHEDCREGRWTRASRFRTRSADPTARNARSVLANKEVSRIPELFRFGRNAGVVGVGRRLRSVAAPRECRSAWN